MSSYVQQQHNYSEDKLSDIYLGQTQGNQPLQSSFENLNGTLSEKGSAKISLVAGKDLNGFQSRTSDIGRVIPQQEILSRIVPFWELFISSVGLFGYHIINLAAHNIGGKRPYIVLFLNGCKSEFQQPNLDECHRHGYPGAFTALWNSPFFLFCYFFKEQNRIDLLTIPNRFMKFRKWTYWQIHRFALALYSLITTILVIYYLTRKTVDNDDLIIQKDYKNGDEFC
ncbi:20356_t:CDS:2 [Dentiscutata erythropus]|uniref:20356_t:CDS:1 n=1 Tax=Dentiscutata erythropus TaxID=1348616 RepID=A0A9N9N6R4_9GLOM|nr:20356_t:CDS:2 [Dentiscutata erythropus]